MMAILWLRKVKLRVPELACPESLGAQEAKWDGPRLLTLLPAPCLVEHRAEAG